MTLFVERDMSKKLVVVIPAMDESDTIGGVLAEVNRLQPDEVVVVVNGATDETADIARDYGATVIEYEERLGNDVGRAVGAIHSIDADIYLFTDADIAIEAEHLLPFITDIEDGAGMTLNAIDWVARHPSPDEPCIDRYLSNIIQGRLDLGLENLLTIPHALSKKAIEEIGVESLANPQLATCIAIEKKVKIRVSNDVDVLSVNKTRTDHRKKLFEVMPEAYQRIHGDTLEAFQYLMDEYGPRLHFPTHRKRVVTKETLEDLRGQWQKHGTKGLADVSFIVPISRHSTYLRHLLKALVKTHGEIIPIIYGNKTEKVVRVLEELNLPYFISSQIRDYGTAFRLGAEVATKNTLVFHEAAIPVDIEELLMMARRVMNKETDIALNDQSDFAGKLEGMNALHMANHFINITCKMNSFKTSALTISPFVMTNEALETIGKDSLYNLCIAHIRATQANLRMQQVVKIDYLRRINPVTLEKVFNPEKILGDILEGIDYWNQMNGFRGGFTDGKRNRAVFEGIPRYYKTTLPDQSDLLTEEEAFYWLEGEKETNEVVFVKKRTSFS